MRRYVLPALALAGVIAAVGAVVHDSRRPSAAAPPVEPPRPPFASFVAGVGVVEASTGNIALGTPVEGVLTDLYVTVGDRVQAGDPLFKIDDRDLQGQLGTATVRVTQAEAMLEKLEHRLAHKQDLYHLDETSVTRQELIDLQDDVAVNEAARAVARAEVARLRADIARHTVRAPVAGRILQVKARVGEYARNDGLMGPLMLLGNDSTLYVRTDIDEYDAWRIRPDAKARAFVRGNPALEIPLRFEYVEPFVVPKTSLTGASTERTDVRVLQVLYSFQRGALPVYIGQRLDVYVEAPPGAPRAPKGDG